MDLQNKDTESTTGPEVKSPAERVPGELDVDTSDPEVGERLHREGAEGATNESEIGRDSDDYERQPEEKPEMDDDNAIDTENPENVETEQSEDETESNGNNIPL